MESKEDRLKKLEAGKEKLAAFRKRKAKKKKPDPQNIVSGTDNSSEDLQNYENGTGLCLPDLPDMKDVWSDEVPSKSTVFLEAKLAQAKHRIAELEEAMEGKQLALDAAIKKSETANLQSKCPAEATKIESSCVDESPELTEFESALAQRDALLSQLSATLFESLGNTELNATVQAQVEALAEHVYQLQAQLHQADKTLEEQFLLHNSSAKAVHDAKCQMIQLQEIITSKDQELALLTEQKNQAMHQEPLQIIQDDGLQTNRDNQILAGEASNLPYIQEVLSSKEQASTLRELDWVAREKEWMSREQEWALRDEQRASREQLLQMSIESQSAQIMALSTSLDTMKTEDRKLRATCAELEAQLKNSQSKAGDKLSHLELELQELRKAYESDQNQIQTLSQVRQELEEKVNSQNICLSQNKVLQEELDALSSKYTECLSLLRDSELAKCDLEEKLRLVNLSPTDVNAKTELDQLKLNYQDQSEKQIERLKNYVELENKYSVDTDALNNKINELQSILQKSEAALQDANDATEAERYIVAGLQKTLQEKNEKLDKQDLKLTQLEEAFRSLQSENRETQQVLNSKEDILASLTEQYKTAQDALEQEKCSYSEQIVVLQDELIAAKHIHGVEQSEQKYHNEQLEEQMETMNSEYESLEAKLKDLEHQLTVEQESKGEILDKMQKLEKEFETVTDEEYCILQTIQSLSNKLELFQEQCKISEIASNEISESEVNTETQNKLSEKWKSECDALIFKIDSLTRGLGQYKVQLEKSEATVNDLTEKLKHSEVMLSSTIMELNSVQQDNLSRAKETEIELERLQARSREAEELETKVAALKDLEQQLLERDKCQEELQSQLEDTVSHWQKLQRIVQEKEVDLQKSQEMLEEQQRICVTLRKTFDEEKEELKSEVNGLEGALHQERDERNRVDCELCDLRGKVNILEGELETLIDAKCSNMAVLSGTIAKLQKELIYAKGRSEMREAEILAVQQGIEEKVENLTIDITEKNTEIDNLKNKAQWKEEEVASLKTELYNLRDESVEQKAAVTQLENTVSSLETQLVQQISVLEGKDLNIKDLNSSNQSQNEKMQVLEAELDDLRKACVKISTSVDQDICGAEDLQAAFRKKDDDLAKLQSLVKQLEADLETERYNRKQVVEAVEKDCEETKAVYESTLAEKAALEKELLLMKHQACEVGNNHELLHAAHSELLLKLEEKGQSLQSLVHEKESVGAELAQTKQHLCQVEGNHKLLQEVHADLQAKHRDIESTVQDSENRKCELETELSQVKNQLSAAEANHTTLQNNCSEIQGKLDESEKSLQCVVTDKKCIELELYQIKQIHLELESKHDNLNVAHSELKEKLENKDQMLEAEAEEKNRLVVEIINLKDQLYDVEENSKIYQTSCSEMQAKLMDIENKFQAAHTYKESLEKELNKASQQLSEMQNKCHLLQDSLSEIQAGEGEKNEASEKLRQTLLEKEGIVSQLKEEKELLSSHLVEMTASYEQLKSSETSLKAAQEKLQVSDEKKGIEISELQNRLKNSEHTGGHMEGIVSSLSNELQQRDETLIEQASQIAKMIEEVEQKSAAFEELGKKYKCLQQQNDLLVSQADSCIKDNNEKQEHLKAQLEKIKQITAVKEEQLLTTEDLFSSQKRSHEETLQRLRKLELESCRVQSELSHYIDCAHEREAYLVDQAKLIDEKICELANVMNELGRKDAELSEIQEKHKSLMEEHAAALSLLESLQSAKETQQADILRLQVDLDNQETASTQYAVECKQLNERLTQMTQVLEGKDAVVFNLNHDIEMYQKEIDDLRSEVVQRDTTIAELQEDLNSAKSTVKRKHEEAEMLKSNFDSCMEDMQVKLTEQEAKTKRLQSQLAEEARNVHQGKDELKEVYEQQISQMEEKIIKCEQQNEQLEKDLEDECKRAASSKDLYEHQLAELELNLQTSNSDLIRYKDELSKVTSNHECAVAGLKRLHEIQSSELEDNCMALEKTVAEQKRQINEMQNKFNKERISLEQNFEIQISDIEEKRRITEHEVDRLKRHLEEMKSDHTREMQQLEKSYESRLFELEDKCCVATSERDRLRASLADQSGMNDSNIAVLESKLQEVEVLRRELELSNHALEDEVLSLKESAQQREEEMMAVLKNVADRHKEDTNDLNLELSRLNEQLLERSKQVEMLKADYEGKIQDLKLNNCKLKEKVKVLEMHAEHDQELQEGERIVDLGAERAELQNMVAAMSEEINSLRFQLSMQRQKERNEHLTCGVEICPPFPSTSEFTQDECFSPTNEKPILEGFVAEHSKQYETSPHSIDRTNSREPGFVEEHEEGFQPEIEDEQIMGTIQPLHTHPIQETVVDEGFQPEMSDIFVMEEPDGIEQDRWLPNLSVGMSPSCRNSNLLQFDYSIQQPDSHDGDSITSQSKKNLRIKNHSESTEHRSNNKFESIEGCTSEAKKFTSSELEKKVQAVRDELEEQYVGKLRKQEVELAHDFATKQENAQREMEQNYVQRVQAIKYEWEQKFTKALQKVRKEMEKKHKRDLKSFGRGTSSSRSTGTSPRATRAEVTSEDQEDLEETVEQLHKENQELAEVRDVLLQQIEISQARGLHTKVQHELQSFLTNRDAAPASPPSPTSSSTTTTPTRTAASPTPEEEAIEVKGTGADYIDADGQSEVSETSSARERFLEELEDIAQQSSQDLPLEWELTTTLMASAMIGAGDNEVEGSSNVESGPPEHRSIWEVFDGRCVRQDCQELDTLRIQYEHQVSSLQRQLEAERRSNQEQTHLKRQQYEQLVCDLREVLGQKHQATLDSALARLSHAHTGEIKRLQAEHQNDICLELTAMKLSLEQVYATKSEMEAQESKQRFDQRLEALNKQHKEELNRFSSAQANTETTASLTEQYNQLVKRISEDLEQQFLSGGPETKHNGIDGDSLEDIEDTGYPSSQEIHNLLQSQQAEIAALRDRLHSGKEKDGSGDNQEEGMDVAELEQQLADLHKQYQAQVEQIQSSIKARDEEQEKEFAAYKKQVEKQQEDLRSHYENKIQDMETSFETEISNMKEKYEVQISGFINSKLNEAAECDFSNESNQQKGGALPTALSTPQQREYIQKTMALTAISDNDSDVSADASSGAPPVDYPARLQVLEAELLDRDSQLNELGARLRRQESSASSETEKELIYLKAKVTQLQQEASTALTRCSELQTFLQQKNAEIEQLQMENKDLNVVLEVKDKKINQLEAEKAESEKLYRDLLERESPRSKGSHGRDMPSGSSVDDSFASARDSIHNTPRSYASDHLEFTSPRSDVGDDENKHHSHHNASNTHELNDSIPFANDSSDYSSRNGNNNNNNNNSNSAALELAVEDLKRKVEELDTHLASAKEREKLLKLQLEESEHHHDEAIEMLKQELEHERKIEVETLQSEFRVQLEVELKRQAAQLCPEGSPVSEAGMLSSSVQQVQMAGPQLDCFSANNNATPVEEPLLQQSITLSQTSERNSILEDDRVDPLLQTSAFEIQQAVQGAHDPLFSKAATAEGKDNDDLNDYMDGVRDTNKSENLSDDSKASSPMGVPSPVHSSTPMAKRAKAEPLTDIEKEMEALRQEYEAKFAQLKAERDAAEERYDRLMQGVQSGEYPELNQLMKDKYDEELELTKSLIQQDFDAQMKEEKKKFVEKHRKLMTDFMADREKEEEEANRKHTEELEHLRDNLNREFEEKLSAYEQENIRLSRDLDLLRDVCQEEREEETPGNDSALPDIEEITLNFQQQLQNMQQTVPLNSEQSDCRDTSTPVTRPESVETGVQYEYEESEEETEAERAPTRQLRSFADVVKSPSPASVQDMEFTIEQLTAQVERLTLQLAQQQQEGAKTPTRSPQHSPENDTLKEEDSALVAMLQSDLERISAERESVQRTNDRLLSLLSDSVKTYVGVEDTINRKLSMVVSGATPRPCAGETSVGGAGSRPTSRPGSVETVPQSGREDSPAIDRKGATPDPDTSQDSHHLEDTSILSNATDEGLEISHRLAESIFVGPDLDAEGEEILTDARSRLTTAVGQLLELMERSTVQLMEAKATQQELLDTLAARGQELESTTSRNTELDSQLAAEIQAKDYLGLELHKAEGLIAGYSAERESLESQVQNLEEQREALIVDLDATRSRLDEFQRSQTEMESLRQDLGRQQELLRDNAGQEMQVEEQPSRSPQGNTTPPALLKEVDSLNQEKRELAEQLQHQLDLSRRRLTELEALAEDAERRHEIQLEERSRQVEDLRLQLDNTERQLKASKAFVAEQMAEREQEREEHQKEVERLEELMQGKDKSANSQQRLQTEIADLTEQLQARMTSQSNMHQRTLELQRALEDKELSAHDLKAWVAQLEAELDQRGSVEEQLKQRISRLELQLTQQQSEEENLEYSDASQTEAALAAGKSRGADSPTITSPSRKPWTSQVSLEEEVLRSQKIEEELQQENAVLKEQVQQQMVQISGLRNQLDQLRHYGGQDAEEDVTQLRTRLQTERDALERSEAQAVEAQTKIEKFEGLLKMKEEEIENIRSKVSKIMEMGDTQEENQTLKSQLEELQGQVSQLSSVSTLPALPPELLEEKNSEIEELRQKIQEQETLQQAQVRELQTRLKERDEEISDLQDNITSLRRGEPYLDVSLPLNEDPDKVLNISMTGRTTRSARAVTPTSIQQELEDTMQEREGEISVLLQEVGDLKRRLADKEEEIAMEKSDKETASSLEETLRQKESEVYELTCELKEMGQQLQDKEQEITQTSEERDKAQEQLNEKEARLDQMILQIDSLQEEITSLTTFQLELQKDFDTVQAMLDDKEKEIESLTKELTDTKTQQETLDTVLHLEKVVATLQKDLREKQNVVEEKEEELYELRDKLEEMGKVSEEVTSLRAEVASKAQLLQQEQKCAKDSQEALEKEQKDLEDIKKERQAEKETEEQRIISLQKSLHEKNSKIKDQEAKIDSLEKCMKEIQEKSQKETASLLDALEKSAADYEKRIVSIEEQLKTQGDNYAALQAAADHSKSIESKVELLNQEIQDKEMALESLQNNLTQSAEQHEVELEDLKLQLVTKEKDHEKMLKDFKNEQEKVLQDVKNGHEKLVADLKSYHENGVSNLKTDLASREVDLQDVRRLLKETEEQLRLRQSALLDAQTEREQLDKLKQTVEEKNQSIAELEGQLRFRQSCILDMEAERERVLEERDDFEAELRQDLEEKEKALQDMQDKYTQLKESLGEEVLHMEQEFQRSSQARVVKTSPGEQDSPGDEEASSNTVESLKIKLSQVSEELAALKSKRGEVEERLAQTNLQLCEREEQLQQLQAEMQQQAEQSQSAARTTWDLQHKLSQMETSLKDAEARAAAKAARLEESQTNAHNLQAKLAEMELAQSKAQSDGNIEIVDKVSKEEVEKMSERHQEEVAKKEHELEKLRQELDKWMEVAAGQDNVQHQVKEQEKQVQTLREELGSRESSISSLQQKLSSKDEELANAQEQLFLLRTERAQPSGVTTQHQEGAEQSLSPETKQSISHLKSQLRKAHAALEEMRTGGEGSGESEEEVEKLRQELRQKEEELAVLRSRFNGEELDTVKTLQDIREDHRQELVHLQDQHDQDVRQLRKVQERKLEQALEELRQALEKEHKTELNAMRVQLQAGNQTLGQMENSSGEGSSRSSLTSEDSLIPQRLQSLLKRLNSLGEHLLSVSDLEYLQQHLTPDARPQGDTSAWSQERRGLMDQIDALKDLLQQADKVAKQGDEERSDWRSDLLQALVSVYEKERRILQAEINTADSLFPEVNIITQLEARLHDLEQVHQSGLDDMLSADRQSLLDEVDSLHHQLLEARAQLQDSKDSLDQRISQLEDAKTNAEWKLQRQIELLEYKLQQEAVVQDDLRKSLRLERGRVTELSQQSSRERARTLELQGELSETQIGLSKARDALEREQQRFSSVTLDWSISIDALEEERAKTNRLAELLESAKRRLTTVEEDVAHSDARYLQRSNSEEEYIQELKSQLTRERQRSVQFSEAEEQAKGQVVQLTDTLDHLKAKVTSLRDEYEAKIETIQRENSEKEMREQRSRLDAEAVTKLTQLLDEERESHQSALEQEKELTRHLRREADRVRLNHSQQVRQLESENAAQVDTLKQELANARAELVQKARRAEALEVEEEVGNRKKLRAVEKDKEELRLKVSQLEQELSQVQDRARQLEQELESHTRKTQQSQDSTDARVKRGHKEAVVTLLTASVIDQELKYRLGQCCNKLQSLAHQLQEMTVQQQQRSRFVQDNFDDSSLAGVMAELDKLRDEIKEREQAVSDEKLQNGSTDSNQVAELVKHNQQLAERVLRLRQDKEHLTNSLELLESRLNANVGRGKKENVTSFPQYVSDVTSDEETVYDRTVWASERLSLQMALDSAEHEIQRLRGELQQFRKFMNAEGQLVTVDHEKTTRLYGKFLRAESFRKALVYQKKYLLLLLGGYRDTEQETLAILASMGGFPSPGVGLSFHGRHTRAFTVFRSAGRTVIAIFRMKYLVRKWKRATRVGSPVMTGQITHQHGYVPSSSSFPTHQRHSGSGTNQRLLRHQRPSATMASAASGLHHPNNNNSNSSSNSLDYVDSMSNGGVSTLTSNMYPGAVRASPLNYTTPPTKDSSRHTRNAPRGNREDARRRILLDEVSSSPRQPSSARSRQVENDDDNFLHYLEKVKEQLTDRDYDTSSPSGRRTGWR